MTTRALFTFDGAKSVTDAENLKAHSGQIVEILGVHPEHEPAAEHRAAYGECLMEIKAADGWTGEAWESELAPLPTNHTQVLIDTLKQVFTDRIAYDDGNATMGTLDAELI